MTKTDPISTLNWQKDSMNIGIGTLNGNIEIYTLRKVNLKYTEEQLEEFRDTIQDGFE